MIVGSNDLFICPMCGSDTAIELPYQRHRILKEAVQNLAEAIENIHIKA